MSEADMASPGMEAGTTGDSEVQTWREEFLAGDEWGELRDSDSLKTIPDVRTLAKAFVDTKALVGRKGVIMPKEDAPPEEWNQFYTALGRPETPEAYEFKPEGLPDDFPYSPEMETGFRQLAHQAGLSKASAKVIYDGYNKLVVEQYQAAQQELKVKVEEMQAGLQKEWGGKFNDNLTLAKSAMQRVAPPGSPELMALDEVIGGSPVLVKFFYNLGKSMGEGEFIAGGGLQNSGLESERQRLMGHPAYLDEKHPEHKATVQKVIEIYNELHPKPEEK